jgi:hypothetical protein
MAGRLRNRADGSPQWFFISLLLTGRFGGRCRRAGMHISEDRISHIAHKILDKLWGDDIVDFPDERRALEAIKASLTSYFSIADEIDSLVRKKLSSYSQAKVPGSRDWEILYQKFYREEAEKKKW